MKNIIKIIYIFLVILVKNLSADSIVKGVIYNRINVQESNILHELIIDPQEVKIILECAYQKCASSEKTSEMSERNKAIAAINGGFFNFGVSNKFKDNALKLMDFFGVSNYNAFPISALKIKNDWFSFANNLSGIFAWKNDGQITMLDAIENEWSLQVGNKIYLIKDLNKPYANGPIVYTNVFDTHTPLRKNIVDITVEENKVVNIKKDGYSKIPKNGFVYSINSYDKSLNLLDFNEFADIKINKIIKPTYSSSDLIEGMDYILGSTPILIKDGKINEKLIQYKSSFYTLGHPRTAVGVLENGNWLMVVVEGRQKSSCGFTILELAEYMLNKGCISALNLDGGGSSTMVINNKVVNSPSGRDLYGYSGKRNERPIADSILILPK
ncbi:MAG: phosphodiester glycosidase family protein [Candidatus Babeliales bacterium]|nr:phosphodiester glycosidase family protein [Candidatus Babeliales bacterium]